MAQAFITTYKNSYRWNLQEKVKPIKLETNYDECYGKNVDWLTQEDLSEKKENFEKVKAAVKQLQVKRMSATTYRTAYCRDWKRNNQDAGLERTIDSFDNQLLESFKETYKEKIGRVLQSITSQRILGFLPPSRMHTPLSTYQSDYGRVGFERLSH